MRCSICNKVLSHKEVSLNKETGKYEPCTACLDEAFDAAYGEDMDDDQLVFESVSHFEYPDVGEDEEDDDEVG